MADLAAFMRTFRGSGRLTTQLALRDPLKVIAARHIVNAKAIRDNLEDIRGPELSFNRYKRRSERVEGGRPWLPT